MGVTLELECSADWIVVQTIPWICVLAATSEPAVGCYGFIIDIRIDAAANSESRCVDVVRRWGMGSLGRRRS